MQTSINFRNIDPSDHLKSYISNKLDRFDRFLDSPAEASVVLTVEKHRHIAEINLSGDRLKVNGKEETNDMYAAIDTVLDKLEKQIKRNKEKKRDKRGRTGTSAIAAETAEISRTPSEMTGADDQEEDAEIIVQSVDVKPMDPEEAVMQLNLSGEQFIVFTNAKTSRINVVYHRNDGHYGLIQPAK